MSYKFAFVMDPLENVLVDKDTTFAFMIESLARGHAIYTAAISDIHSRGAQVTIHARRCEVMRATPHFRYLDEGQDYAIEHFAAVWMRKDPPADANYQYAAMLLALADPRRTFVLNDPIALVAANEKLYALNFPHAIPPTLVSYESARLRKFMTEQDGQMIVKPLDGHGGESVFYLHIGDRNLGAILETITRFQTRPVMAQRYLPEIRAGDKRLIVLNGEPLGATLRVPREGELRGNIHVGGTCVKAPITPRDREICAMLADRLKHDGLYFVGLDIIGDFLTEVNVTSPTGVQEIDRLDNTNLEAKVVDFVEARCAGLER